MYINHSILKDKIKGNSLYTIADQRFLGTAEIAKAKLAEGLIAEGQIASKDAKYLEIARLEELHRLFWPEALSGSVKAAQLINAMAYTRCKIINEIENIQEPVEATSNASREFEEVLAEMDFYYLNKDEFLQWKADQEPHWEQLDLLAS
jgi:hypothetical protein